MSFCDRDFIELDLQGGTEGYFNPDIPKAIVRKSQDQLVKANKLVNGYFDKFLPSYIDTFDFESDNNVESYKSYYKVCLALNEIIEFIDIFSGESIYDMDKDILITNLKSFKLLTDSRLDKVKLDMEESKCRECGVINE